MTGDGPELFREVRRQIEYFIELTHAWHSAVLATFVMQTYLTDVLNSVFYVGLLGPKGSGKTTALSVVCEMSRNGIMTGNASLAALARMIAGHTLFIDELDELKGDNLELTQAAFRQGYRRGSYYLRWDATTKSADPVDVFSSKMVTFRTGVEDALATRMYPIPMAPAKASPVAKALDNMTRDLTPMREKLTAWADAAIKEFPKEKVAELVASPRFRAGITNLIGPFGTPREVEISAVMLVVAAIVGVDILAEIAGAVQGQRDGAFDDELFTLQEFIVAQWASDGRPDLFETETVRARWNATRKDSKEPPHSPYKFRSLLRELGFRDGATFVRKTSGRAGKGRSALAVQAWQAESLTDPSKSLTIDEKSLTEFRKSFTVPQSPSPSEGPGEGLGQLVRDLERVVKESLNSPPTGEGVGERSPPKSFTLEDAVVAAAAAGLKADKVEDILKRWLDEGKVYQPTFGRWKFT